MLNSFCELPIIAGRGSQVQLALSALLFFGHLHISAMTKYFCELGISIEEFPTTVIYNLFGIQGGVIQRQFRLD